MLPEAVEAGDSGFASRQRVALHFHVEKELCDDADESAPQQYQADLRGNERPEHELSGRKAHASRDDAGADQPPVVARGLGHVTNGANRCFGRTGLPRRSVCAKAGHDSTRARWAAAASSNAATMRSTS